jgi:hypothetical protein
LALGIDRSPSRRLLSLGALVMLALLLVQFLVGMFVNLYVGITSSHPGASAAPVVGAILGVTWAVSAGGPALALHTVLGLLLTVGSVALLVMALVASRGRALVMTTAVGLLGVLGAGLSGIGFLNYNVDKATYLMSVGFSIAVAGYVTTLFVANLPARRRRGSEAAHGLIEPT